MLSSHPGDAHRATGPGPTPESGLQPAPWVRGRKLSPGTHDGSLWQEPAAAGKGRCVPERKMVRGHVWTEGDPQRQSHTEVGHGLPVGTTRDGPRPRRNEARTQYLFAVVIEKTRPITSLRAQSPWVAPADFHTQLPIYKFTTLLYLTGSQVHVPGVCRGLASARHHTAC